MERQGKKQPDMSHKDESQPNQTAFKRFLTPREVSERYAGRLSTGTLANLRSSGNSIPYKKISGRILYDIADIEEYERTHTYRGSFQYKK